ncbi:NAD-dependent epimerase/dehydratase family protein [Stieleria sp. JC731]|uniref:NAD-dependent epimerase/dehydratase family protein n=1 Tax=Pirellulaceae TaxID=2691357 RepID=UPI001E37BFA3|nr:NAD-dependent epimerase/dehydratase family protein [Stieleria sp. JC731]MCC9600226.1 NAD-dependent epimerase/dehydratase family protein [Stieleria sp. JC731]
MRILVTGATGLLGNTIIRELARQGYHSIAFVRKRPDPEVFQGIELNPKQPIAQADQTDGLEVLEVIEGEFADDPTSNADGQKNDGQPSGDAVPIESAIESCDAVIHCAAMIHLGWKQQAESMRVNRDGTKRIAQACLQQRKRLIYIGTVNAIALGSREMIADEDTPLAHAGGQVPCAYVESKRAGTEEVHRAVASGLDAVIVHPGFMLGPWDWKPSSGRMLIEVGKSWKPVAPRGGCSLCDSRDVAKGVVSAIDYDGESGRQFIMAGHNLTYRELWTEMANRMDSRPPVQTLGPGVEYLAGLVGDLWTKVSGNETDVNSAQVRMSGQYHWYDSSRAIRELDYEIRSADKTLDDAAEWIRNRFVLPS